jgi:hypothetical protein
MKKAILDFFWSFFGKKSASADSTPTDATPVETVHKPEPTVFYIYNTLSHSLDELRAGGCQVQFSPKDCNFARCENDYCGTVHLIRIPEWKKMGWRDGKHWSPIGYFPLGVRSLINFGVEYPDLQKSRIIVATGAPDDSVAGVYYPYLSAENDQRLIGVPNWGVSWIGDNGKEGDESNFFGIFGKYDPY